MVELQVNVFPNVILQNYLIHRHHGHCGLFDLWFPNQPLIAWGFKLGILYTYIVSNILVCTTYRICIVGQNFR